jgi:predicted nucleic acid-binding protein
MRWCRCCGFTSRARCSRVSKNRGTLAAPKADNFIAELKALRIAAGAESAARVFSDVHRLALDHRLTSYDAAYLELAQRRNLPLATLDDELIRASKARQRWRIAAGCRLDN